MFWGELNFNPGVQSVVLGYYVNMKDVFCQTCCVYVYYSSLDCPPDYLN